MIKSSQGHEYSLVYIISHTYHDDELNLDYSNEGSLETQQLEKMFEYVNELQAAGYKNITVHTEVFKDDDEAGCTWLIQDSVSDLDLKVNHSIKEEVNTLDDALERLEQYDKFLKNHNSQDAFEKYLNEIK